MTPPRATSDAGIAAASLELARTGDPAQRTLALAVLVQAVRTPAPHLVQAIRLVRVESRYDEPLQAYDQRRP